MVSEEYCIFTLSRIKSFCCGVPGFFEYGLLNRELLQLATSSDGFNIHVVVCDVVYSEVTMGEFSSFLGILAVRDVIGNSVYIILRWVNKHFMRFVNSNRVPCSPFRAYTQRSILG